MIQVPQVYPIWIQSTVCVRVVEQVTEHFHWIVGSALCPVPVFHLRELGT